MRRTLEQQVMVGLGEGVRGEAGAEDLEQQVMVGLGEGVGGEAEAADTTKHQQTN